VALRQKKKMKAAKMVMKSRPSIMPPAIDWSVIGEMPCFSARSP
jgi:hypothetical protein